MVTGSSDWRGPVLGFLLAVSAFGQSVHADQRARVLFDFRKPEAVNDWQTVNDDVMGGVSEGRLRITDDGKMEFWGALSLENNGGFASVRSKPRKLGLTGRDSLLLKIKGDGREYYVSLYVPTFRVAFSYRAAIQTKKDQWQEVAIPLGRFRATSFGRLDPDAAPIDPTDVNSVGFLIADKKAGPFKLEVEWMKVVQESEGD